MMSGINDKVVVICHDRDRMSDVEDDQRLEAFIS
jgi:hypothetical protein